MREKEAAQWKEKVLFEHHEQRLHLIQLLLSKYVMELMNMQAFLSRIDLAFFCQQVYYQRNLCGKSLHLLGQETYKKS